MKTPDAPLLWAAAYGAAFARMMLDHVRDGHDCATRADEDRWCEEARTIAGIAVDAATRTEED